MRLAFMGSPDFSVPALRALHGAGHEIDHLDGVLFVDHLSALKRNMILRRLAKELRQKRTEAM